MIWNSISLMTGFDIVILMITIVTLGMMLRARYLLIQYQLLVGLSVVVSGLILIGLFYLADLVTKWVLPSFTTKNTTIEVINILHLHYNWINMLAVTLCIFGGFVLIMRRLLSLIRLLEESEAKLHREAFIRAQVNHDLRASETRFRDLIEGSIQGILIHRDDQALFVNQACANIFGYASTAEIETLDTLLALIAPHERERLAGYRAARLAGRAVPHQYEYQGVRKDGSQVWLDMTVRIVRWDEELAIQSIVTDISDRKRAEAALRKSEERITRHNQELEQAVQAAKREMEALMARMVRHEKLAAIGQISGSIAHELRNPLGAVKQAIFLLNRLYHNQHLEASHPKVPEYLHLMDREIDAAEQVISQLLTFARAKPPEPEWVDLQGLLKSVSQSEVWAGGMQLCTALEPEPFCLWADPWAMQHIFTNLLSNAADACVQQGVVTINAHVDHTARQYRIDIHDTGCGIAAESLACVFEPLYTQKTWGTGLGLSLCQRLMEQQGGTITLESQPGEGTTVYLRLPLPPETDDVS